MDNFLQYFYLFPYTQQNTSSSQLFLFISLKFHSYKTNLTGLQPVSRPVEQVPLIVGVKSHTLTYTSPRFTTIFIEAIVRVESLC